MISILSKLIMVRSRTVFLMIRRPLISTLFPYTTLFRSGGLSHADAAPPEPGAVVLTSPLRDARREPHRRSEDSDRKSTRLNSSHVAISYAVFCLKKKQKQKQ